MATAPQLAAWLRDRRDAIVAGWRSIVGALPRGRAPAHPVLAPRVGTLVEAIAARIGGDAQSMPPILDHFDGTDVASLLAEHAALRRAILEVARDTGRVLAPEEQIALGVEIDRAIAVALTAHLQATLRAAEARTRAEAAVGVLADVGAAIGASLAPERLLQRAAEAVVGPFADVCAVHLVRGGRASGDDFDSAAVAGVSELLGASPAELGAAMRSRAPSWSAEGMLVPLEAGEQLLGVLECRRAPARAPDFDEDDVRIGAEIAARIALGLANTRLFEAAKLEARARDGLLAIVSHDLKNPLGVITMGASTLATRLPDDPRTRQTLESIRRAAARMHKLITDLLDTARVHGGQLALEPTPIEVGALLDEAIEDARWLAYEKEVALEADADPIRGIQVAGDRDRLLQVLGNLLGNAIKFSPVRGRVSVSVEPSASEVIFSVADQGPGIPASDVEHVFDPYWSGHKPGSGTGLGLFIAHGIVAGHGGRIWVEAVEPRGTRFRFSLPAA